MSPPTRMGVIVSYHWDKMKVEPEATPSQTQILIQVRFK